MRSRTPSFLLSVAGIFLFFLCFAIYDVRADLRYYVYTEEEEQSNREERAVIVLRSIGSLPLHKSTFVTTGEGCPEMVTKAGGLNPNYMCAGAQYSEPNDSDEVDENDPTDYARVAFFPIAPADSAAPKSKLPFRYASFQRSRGIPNGLLMWRNALVVDIEIATSESHPHFLDAVSMGVDTSKETFNSDWVSSHEDGAVIAEWYLLSEEGGDPIRDGGSIKLIKGRPASLFSPDQYDDDYEEVGNDDFVVDAAPQQQQQEQEQEQSSKNDTPVSSTSEPQQQHKPSSETCKSITDTICDDENNDKFGTLCSLMMQVGLDQMLSLADGPDFTLYAPTNDGFSRAFVNKPQPALLSGHDLTKLLLSHMITTGIGTESDQSETIGLGGGSSPTSKASNNGISYEEMVCGTKQIMASQQIVKVGCDANSEVAYVVGKGNGGKSSPRPKFLDVDYEACNGIIHTLDYVILPSPSSKKEGVGVPHQHFHDSIGGTVNIAGETGSSTSETTNEVAGAKVNGDNGTAQQPQLSQQQTSFDSKTNQLDESQVKSFFQQTKEDLGDEPERQVTPPTSKTVEEDETSTAAIEAEMIDNDGIDTESKEFQTFFGRNPARPGNLRRR